MNRAYWERYECIRNNANNKVIRVETEFEIKIGV